MARARRTTRRLQGIGAGLLSLAMAWAMWPISRSEPSPFEGDARPVGALESRDEAAQVADAFDLTAFDAPLWAAPAPPRVAATPPSPPVVVPPPPPLKVQLLGIFAVRGEARRNDTSGAINAPVEYRAVLYDPDQDAVVIVASGDAIAQRVVESIDAARVALRDSAGLRTISLRPDQPLLEPRSADAAEGGRP